MKIKGIYLLYRLLQAFVLPLVVLYFFWRALRNPGYGQSLRQRLGFLPHPFRQTGPGAIWLHAVSVGEILGSLEFLKGLRRVFPRTRIFVSTSTLAGRAVADEKLAQHVDGIFYAPVDYVWAVRRVLRTLRPSLVLTVETEIWPNLFREVKRTGAALAVVNGRISDRAFPRYRRLAWAFRAVLPAVDAIQAQTDTTRDRFILLGAPAERTQSAGNFKYDFQAKALPPGSEAMAFLERLRPAKVWIAASTMPPAVSGDVDEDDAILAAFQELAVRWTSLLLILAPRKPEQFDVAAAKLQTAGIPYVRRSLLDTSVVPALPAVLLLDSIGELSGLFAAADVVFMGGTLAQRGGHNLLEPAFFAKPIIVGPHIENFQAIADEFRGAGACLPISGAAELAGAVDRLLVSPETAGDIGRRALACAEARRGATGRALALARELYKSHLPRYRPALPWLPLLQALSWLWTAGARRGAARSRSRQKRLPVPVISVGNLTMGGTGKTPCVLRLAAEFKQRGRKPGILTRGYGRSSPERKLTVAPGETGSVERTGDEAQLFIQSGLAPVGIAANRFAAGTLLYRRFDVDVLLLDDGFQHQRLARSLDIVLVDALDPFGGGAVFPLGRLREPLASLHRADLFLITRSDFTDLPEVIEGQIRRWNAKAPIFRARLQPKAWVHHGSGIYQTLDEAPFRSAVAFCGLGNPASFRRTLERLRAPLADWLEFADHHRYQPREIQRLRAHALAIGADALVTTEKDAVNLCEEGGDLPAPLPIFWLAVELVIENERDFLAEVERRLE